MKPYYQDGTVTIYHGNCREVLSTLPVAGLVLTDPPYGIGQKWTRSAKVTKNGSSRLWGQGERWDNSTVDSSLISSAIGHGERAIIWGGNYYCLPPARCWLIWDKVQKFNGGDAELAWTNLDLPVRVFRLSRIDAFMNKRDAVKEHPTEKPARLMRWCIQLARTEGVVLDPFAGSGSTLRAAKDLGRRAIGVEVEERYCEIAARRLAQDVFAVEMPETPEHWGKTAPELG